MPCVKYPDLRLVDQNLVRQLERRADGKAKHRCECSVAKARGRCSCPSLSCPVVGVYCGSHLAQGGGGVPEGPYVGGGMDLDSAVKPGDRELL